MLYEYPAIFYMIEEACRISFPNFGRIIQVAALFDVMTESLVFWLILLLIMETRTYLCRRR